MSFIICGSSNVAHSKLITQTVQSKFANAKELIETIVNLQRPMPSRYISSEHKLWMSLYLWLKPYYGCRMGQWHI